MGTSSFYNCQFMFLGSRETGSRKGRFGRIPGFCRPGDTKDWRGPRKKEAQDDWKAGKPDTSFSQQRGNQILKGQSIVSCDLKPCALVP